MDSEIKVEYMAVSQIADVTVVKITPMTDIKDPKPETKPETKKTETSRRIYQPTDS